MTAAKLTLRLLGAPQIDLNDRPLTNLPSRAAEALLFYLAVTARPQARDVLAELLWSERDPQQALANLRSILSGMRRTLKPFLDITRQTIALRPDANIWLDVAAFERCMADLEPLLQKAAPLTAPQAAQLEQTLALYHGDFLEGFYLREGQGFEEWAFLQGERLGRLAQKGLMRLSKHHLHAGSYGEGVVHARRLLAANPLDERAARLMILLLARSGQTSAALQQYGHLRDRLAGELDLAPAAETTALYERIRSAQSRPRHNLPPDPTPFVGRHEELQALHDNLARPGCRLITILGPGGVGKTRLMRRFACRLAEEQPGRFLHGICYVTLAHLDDPHRLAATIAQSLNLSLSSGDAAAELVDFLREKELLLLLDNFENLLPTDGGTAANGGTHAIGLPLADSASGDEALALIAAILREAPLVTIVATSRRPLQLQEEWRFELGGLPSPPDQWRANGDHDAAQPGDYPAVALFMKSAQRADHTFAPAPADWQAIASVCRRLDGLPLGIELAANWVRQLSCAEIDARIEADLGFLTSAAHNIPSRHRNLRAVFEQSWQMLSAPQQQTAALLSVFQAPFNMQAAEALAGEALGPQAAPSTARLVASLTSAFILRQSAPAPAAASFEMHPLLQQIAVERLEADPRLCSAARNAHAAVVGRFVAQFTGAVKGGAQEEAFREIGAIIDDIRAAWSWDLQRGFFANIEHSLEALFYYYWARGWLQEGAGAAERLAAAATEAQLLIRARMWQGEFYSWLGRYEEALDLLQRAQRAAQRHNLLQEYVFIAGALGRTHFYLGDNGAAIPVFEDGLERARRLQDEHWIALLLNGLGICLAESDADYARARALFAESLHLCRRIGDEFGTARALLNLGSVYQEAHELDQAHQLFTESLALYRRTGYAYGISSALNYLSQLAYRRGDYEEAHALVEESYALNHDSGNRWSLLDSLKQMGNVDRAAGRLRRAKQHYDEALNLVTRIGAARLTLAIIAEVAALMQLSGDPDSAALALTFILQQPDAGRELHDGVLPTLQAVQQQLDPGRLQCIEQQAAALTLSQAVAHLLAWPLPERRARAGALQAA